MKEQKISGEVKTVSYWGGEERKETKEGFMGEEALELSLTEYMEFDYSER